MRTLVFSTALLLAACGGEGFTAAPGAPQEPADALAQGAGPPGAGGAPEAAQDAAPPAAGGAAEARASAGGSPALEAAGGVTSGSGGAAASGGSLGSGAAGGYQAGSGGSPQAGGKVGSGGAAGSGGLPGNCGKPGHAGAPQPGDPNCNATSCAPDDAACLAGLRGCVWKDRFGNDCSAASPEHLWEWQCPPSAGELPGCERGQNTPPDLTYASWCCPLEASP